MKGKPHRARRAAIAVFLVALAAAGVSGATESTSPPRLYNPPAGHAVVTQSNAVPDDAKKAPQPYVRRAQKQGGVTAPSAPAAPRAPALPALAKPQMPLLTDTQSAPPARQADRPGLRHSVVTPPALPSASSEAPVRKAASGAPRKKPGLSIESLLSGARRAADPAVPDAAKTKAKEARASEDEELAAPARHRAVTTTPRQPSVPPRLYDVR